MTTPLSRGRQIAANKKTVIAEMEASPMYDHLPIIRGMPNADARSVANSFARYPSDYADALACKYVFPFHKTDADNLKSVLKANSKWHLLIPAWFGVPDPKCPLLTDKSPFSDVEEFIDAQEERHPGTRTYFVFTDDDTTAMLIKLSM
jgi:hypothetical protein